MQQQQGFKRFLPDLLVIAIFLIISCAFCYPAFQGNVINQSDSRTWLEGSTESREHYEKTGENAFWANNMFSGMPQNMLFIASKNDWYDKIDFTTKMGENLKPPNPAMYFILAMTGFFLLMNALKVNRWLGMIGAIAFAFSSYNPQIIVAGHTTKMLDIAYLPGILAGVIIAYRGKYFQGSALAGFLLAFSFNAGHWQIIYYGAITIGVLGIAKLVTAIKKGELKRWFLASLVLGLAAGLALMTCYTRLAMVREYEPYSMRGGKGELTTGGAEKKSKGLEKEYAFRWSVGVGESFCLLVPNLYGGAMSENIGEDSHFGQKLSEMGAQQQQIDQITAHAPLYWGAQQETLNLAGPVYFGAVICLLFVLALLVVRSRYKWWIAGLSFFFILLAMGKNFPALNYFMFDHFPMYNKFRAPSMNLAVPSILFPVLAMWALKDIYQEKITREELWKKLRIAIGITGGLCLILFLATKMSFDYKGAADSQLEQQYGQAGPELMKALREDRADASSGDALRSLIFVLLAGGVLWAYSKGKVKKEMVIAGIGLLIAVDEIPVASRYLNKSNFMDETSYIESFQPSQSDRQILSDTDPYYRVIDLTTSPFNDPRASLFHKSVGGYHGAKMQIYQELIERQLGNLNYAVLNMLNTKYLIVPDQNRQPLVQKNPEAMGNAWFVNEVKWVKTADEEMNALNATSLNNPMDSTAGNFKPGQTAILRDTFRSNMSGYSFGKDSAAYVRLAPNGYGTWQIKFESNNSQNGLAVFSDIYYPIGWKATVDGKETPIMRADYVLRAVKVPSGKHTIEFTYSSPAYHKGEKVTLAGSILLTLLIAAGLFFGIRQVATGTAPEVAANEPQPVKKK